MVAPALTKTQWIQYYASQIYNLYNCLQHPLDISEDYKTQIKRDLEPSYSDPLRRNMIEMTYCQKSNHHLSPPSKCRFQ